MKPTVLMAAALLAPGLLRAQSVAERVARAPDGVVRMSYTARAGVCGNGTNINTSRDRDSQWESDCDPGPVRVVFKKTGSAINHVEVRVGGSWRANAPPATDLGMVRAPDAARYLLDVARKNSSTSNQSILAAQLADSVTVWPELLAMAKDKDLPKKTRQSALFWVGQSAGDKVVETMGAIAEDASEDREVREAAVFGLSRRPADESVPALIKISESDRDPEIRRNAMFWLSRSDDPRATAWFEKVLTRR
ncbi:MAG TPA: HEAT repeat domain-containing protein [Gemmatimonadales bacterium]|nr:HEAT repeat domain-containing protein [Gemmatimonadales bacterium]